MHDGRQMTTPGIKVWGTKYGPKEIIEVSKDRNLTRNGTQGKGLCKSLSKNRPTHKPLRRDVVGHPEPCTQKINLQEQ